MQGYRRRRDGIRSEIVGGTDIVWTRQCMIWSETEAEKVATLVLWPVSPTSHVTMIGKGAAHVRRTCWWRTCAPHSRHQFAAHPIPPYVHLELDQPARGYKNRWEDVGWWVGLLRQRSSISNCKESTLKRLHANSSVGV